MLAIENANSASATGCDANESSLFVISWTRAVVLVVGRLKRLQLPRQFHCAI